MGTDPVHCAVREAFGSLSLRQQTVLWMTEVEDRPASEISDALGISLGAVYALGLRSRRTMRRAYLEALALDAASRSPARVAAAQVGTADARPTS
jgi:DNA-directed RNA polymerase specialized sigma24 family protein